MDSGCAGRWVAATSLGRARVDFTDQRLTPMSTSFITVAPEAEPTRQNSSGRLINLIVDPVSAFRGIADDSRWMLAFAVAVTLRFGSLFVFYRPAVTPMKVAVGLVFQVTTVAPQLLFASALIWTAAKAWGLGVRWKSTFSVTTHVYVAYTLATIAVASVAGAVLPESTEIDLRSPPFTNLAWLVPELGGLARRILEEFDIRYAYVLVLLRLGLRGASTSETHPAVVEALATVAVVRLVGVLVLQAMQ
jgi:hypothetical protein